MFQTQNLTENLQKITDFECEIRLQCNCYIWVLSFEIIVGQPKGPQIYFE